VQLIAFGDAAGVQAVEQTTADLAALPILEVA
jgi:hypothetical protein